MPMFYFHVRSNGLLQEDMRGRQYNDHQEACVYAIKSMPQLLAKALKSVPQLRTKPLEHGNIYVTVNVVDEQRRACVVKGTVVVAGSPRKSPAAKRG
jgi:aromatic ring hydroxylase